MKKNSIHTDNNQPSNGAFDNIQIVNSDFIDGMNHAYKEAIDQAYSQGLNQGINQGYSHGLSWGFNKGITEGYNKGLEDGYNKAISEHANTDYKKGPVEFNSSKKKDILKTDSKNLRTKSSRTSTSDISNNPKEDLHI